MHIALMVLVLIGAEFPICTESTNSQYYPSAFYANSQYYAFWADARYYNTNYTYCLYAARVSTAGAVLDPNGKLCFRDSCISKPAVSYDGSNFLVSFRNGCWSYGDIVGVRVTPNADTIRTVTISAAANVQFQADAVYGGGYHMVVWTDYRSGSAYQIYGARVSPTGAVQDPSGIAIGPATATTYQYYPSVGFNGTRYFVIWGYYSSPYAVTGRFINTNGTFYGDTIRIASAASYVYGTRIAYDGTNFMILWIEYGTYSRLKGIRVSGTTGAPIGSSFTIADSVYYYGSIGLNFANSRYLVVFCKQAGSYYQMMGRYYSTSGAPMGAAFNITNNAYNCYYGDVAAGPSGRYFNLWSEYRTTYDIYGNVDVVVGVEENAAANERAANLRSTVVRDAIELKNASGMEMKIYDASGRLVGQSATGHFDLSHREGGVYFVRLADGAQFKVIKVQ